MPVSASLSSRDRWGYAVFGHFGDRIGRKSTLVASLLIMGGSTVAIGLLPTYGSVGWLAPLLLCILRFAQGFGLGGEWGGAVLLAVENAPPGWHARFGMAPQLGAPLGFIMANGLFLLLGLWLTPADFLAWGWRLPFLASVVLVALGLWIRLKLTETPAFAAAIKAAPPARVPLAELLRNFRARPSVHLRRGRVFRDLLSFDGFVGYGTAILGYSRTSFSRFNWERSCSWRSARSPPALCRIARSAPQLMGGCVGTIGVGFLLAPMLGSGSLAIILVSCRSLCS